MTTHEMSHTEYRTRFAPPDDPQDTIDAESYRRLVDRQTANGLLRGLDEAKPARAHPELDWRREVVMAAELAGYRVYWTWNSVNSPAGFPDLVLCKPGRPVIFAELKAENGRLSAPQVEWLELLSQVPGVFAETWRPSDLDHVLDVLQK